MATRVRDWVPPVAIAALLFVASSIPGTEMPQVAIPHLDKIEHGTAYGLLGASIARAALRSEWPVGVAIALGGLLSSAYGASDEYHQKFTPHRSVEVADWAADTLGGFAGATAFCFGSKRRARG